MRSWLAVSSSLSCGKPILEKYLSCLDLLFRRYYGPEFTAQSFVDWCTAHRVAIHDIQPGKPDQDAYIERFNRSYRTEVLNAHLFESLGALRAMTDTWLRIYNGERPHDSLGRVPPLTFLPRPSSARESTLAVST
ncbi:MAG: transposase [Planctomycetota bacterium]